MRWTREPVPLGDLPQVTPSGIAGRYLSDNEFAQRFYGSHWQDDEALKAVADAVQAREYPRAELAGILTKQNERWGMTDETSAAIDRIRNGAVTVFTGQQAGLFGGPLYTAYKALASVAWARTIGDRLGVAAVPVFWIAGDDHDFDEINHIAVQDASGVPVTLRCQSVGPSGARVSKLHLCDDIQHGIDQIASIHSGEPHADDLVQHLRETYRPGETWVDAFARFMSRLVGSYGIVFISPDDTALKHLMAHVFQSELADPLRSRQALKERDAELRQHGYEPQVRLTDTGTLLFLDSEDGRRHRLDFAASDSGTVSGFSSPNTALSEDRSHMEALLRDSPGHFSANALLRPVSADAVFPTVLHVMGPGEIGYMAQARALYDLHGIPMPVTAPRAAFTVIEPEIAHCLESQRLNVREAFKRPDDIVGNRARDAYAAQYAHIVDTLRTRTDAAYTETANALAANLPGIRLTALSAQIKTHSLIGRLERKVQQEIRRMEAANRPDLERISHALFPNGTPQERVYPALAQLARYGAEWFDALLALLEDDLTTHRAVFPGS